MKYIRDMGQNITCQEHGEQGVGRICTHIANANGVDPLGFMWGDIYGNARPDGWCKNCEAALRAIPQGQSYDPWYASCDFQVLCEKCWDLAKFALYDMAQKPGA